MENRNRKTKFQGGIKRALCFMLCAMMLLLCVDSTVLAKEKKLEKYDYVGNFSDGLAVVEKNGKYGYIDKNGKEVVKPKYDKIESFSEGLAVIKKNGKWGYIDKKGNEVIELKYADIEDFSEGLAKAWIINDDGNWELAYIDKTGKVILE